MQQIKTYKTTSKVANRTVQSASKGIRIPKRLRDKHHKKSTAQVFRLSMLDASDAYLIMPNWANQTLFKLCLAYCDKFDPYKELLPKQTTTYMIETIKEHFGIPKKKHIGVCEDKIVVSHSLQYDFYNYEVSCISNLKNKAKPLYIAFSTLLTTIGFQRLEVDTCCFYEEFMCNQMEHEGKKKEHSKSLKKFEKGQRVYNDFEQSALETQEALQVLKSYRGKKQEYLRIATFLKKWVGERFFFIDSAPYQFYEIGENHDTMYEHCEIPYRMGFYTTKGKSFESFLNDENQNRFNNETMCDPCWTISEDCTGTVLQQNVTQFEEFSLELLEVLQIIKKL